MPLGWYRRTSAAKPRASNVSADTRSCARNSPAFRPAFSNRCSRRYHSATSVDLSGEPGPAASQTA